MSQRQVDDRQKQTSEVRELSVWWLGKADWRSMLVIRSNVVQQWRYVELDGCILLNTHNTVFGSKLSAIYATVKLSYNVFFKLNDLLISTSVPATWRKVPVCHTGTYRQKNQWNRF